MSVPGEEAERADGQGGVVGLVVVGTFLVALDVSLVNTGLPAISRDLQGGKALNWVFLAYLIAVAVAQPPSAWVAERMGRVTAFGASLAVFTAGAVMAAAAPSLAVLAASRAVQGIGAGAVFPIGLAVIHDAVPAHRRGGAFGWWGASTMVAPMLAPVLSGAIIAVGHWRALFAVDLVIGAGCVVVAARVRRHEEAGRRSGFDHVGFLLASIGLVLLLAGLDGWKDQPFDTLRVGGAVAAGAAVLAVFVGQQLSTAQPILDLRIFGGRLFSVSIGLVWTMAAVQYARIFIVPVELQAVFGLSAFEAGLAIIPAGAATAVTMRLGGRLTDVIGPRVPVVVGVCISAAAAWQLAVIGAGTPLSRVVVVLGVQGLGVGISMLPVTVVSMTSVPGPMVTQAAAVNSISRQIAGVLAVAVLAAVISSRAGSVVADGVPAETAMAAYNAAYRVVLATLGASLLLAMVLPGTWRRSGATAVLAPEAATGA